ncbi:MAG: amidase [Alphaproteobacteria bacterium]|nr:amidase [Alphaproteobacteria bacterium]
MRAMILALGLLLVPGGAALAASYDVVDKDIATLQADMAAGRIDAAGLVEDYQARIAAIDPLLHSVIALNPDALAQARALDGERKAGHLRGPLHGIPILVKDNIETQDPMPTTAGSLALAGNITHRDAPVVARLRAAGAIILGKTNLSEWANIRSTHSISGWSAIGGWTRNPYVLDRSTCGSSAGTGAAIAASLAAAGLGTETNGSLVCPGAFNSLVSLKPTVGLVSRTHIVPISHTQDTAGPMARTVADAALLLSAMAGSDPADSATAPADAHRIDYAVLGGASLKGKRLGVIVPPADQASPAIEAVLQQAIAILRREGAEIVEIRGFLRPEAASDAEGTVLKFEFKHDIAAYLQSLPGAGPKTLADLIAFNARTPRELALFDQDYFEMANEKDGLDDPVYIQAREELLSSTRALLDKTLKDNRLDALIRPTEDMVFRLDVIKGDNDGPGASFLPAVSGYPHLTVPMGYVRDLPVGLSFIGPAWSEASLLAMGAAFEHAAAARKPPSFLPSLETKPDVAAALAPLPR